MKAGSEDQPENSWKCARPNILTLDSVSMVLWDFDKCSINRRSLQAFCPTAIENVSTSPAQTNTAMASYPDATAKTSSRGESGRR